MRAEGDENSDEVPSFGEGLDDEPRGILRSVADLPKTKALGVELRKSSALAAPISAIDGSFEQEPLRIRHSLGDNPEENVKIVSETLKQCVKHFAWKGVLGCAFTNEVARCTGSDDKAFSVLEEDVGKMLEAALKRSRLPFVKPIIHTTAAAYSELVWGECSGEELWKDQAVVMCTLGRNIGAVIFNDGKRVQHTEWCRPTMWPTPDEVSAIMASNLQEGEYCISHAASSVARVSDGRVSPIEDSGARFSPQQMGTDEWAAWVRLIDCQLSDIISAVPAVDRVILLPTGRTASLTPDMIDHLTANLSESSEAAKEKGAELMVRSQAEGAVVRGAAIGALMELQQAQMMQYIKPVVMSESSLQALSDGQLRVIYNKLDINGDGDLTSEEICRALEMLGIVRDHESLVKELDDSMDGIVQIEEFVGWWQRSVGNARVVNITSASAWRTILNDPPPEGFDDIIVLEVTFTFCRVCKAFVNRFRQLAETYDRVRFVTIVGNATIGAMEMCSSQLKVKVSPAFFVFRRGGELLGQWTGANVPTFKKNLDECLEKSGVKAVST